MDPVSTHRHEVFHAWLYSQGNRWEEVPDPVYEDENAPEDWGELAQLLGYQAAPEIYGTKASHSLEVYYPVPSAFGSPRYPYRMIVYARTHTLHTIYVKDFLAYQELMPRLLNLVQKSLQVSLLSQHGRADIVVPE